ncbi:hypothetical protein K432DRAFT_320920 [Lepidopterella palustris CBS 459.81]|uniref:Thioesterase-like superfamily-domain-containing protein n=1 Tax=Lepidopterella palustris CBS 459.81 TaxID=1314670 RepID=A0A8E2EHY9_9PEZI|nr:hypothetical protein K432DRAFT_320920 [Lepidopterella palustris CBS 459.81]
MTSWAEATAIKALDSHTYSSIFPADWCIGKVPHGGFVTGCFLGVVSTHFNTTLSRQNQPHTITLHLEFLRRTQEGPAIFKVQDVKLGRQASVVHVSMSQDGREEVVGYITNSNFHTEEGVSFDTKYELHPPAPPVDFLKLKDNKDENWARQEKLPFPNFRKATQKVKWFFPRNGQAMKSLADEWLCFTNGEKFTNTSLGYVADMFPQIVENYKDEKAGPFWYPTLLLNLDIKKPLPEEGVEWLFARVRSKQIKNGRLDLEVIVLDEGGDIVALSHHVCLVLDAGRNLAARKNPSKGDGAKI